MEGCHWAAELLQTRGVEPLENKLDPSRRRQRSPVLSSSAALKQPQQTQQDNHQHYHHQSTDRQLHAPSGSPAARAPAASGSTPPRSPPSEKVAHALASSVAFLPPRIVADGLSKGRNISATTPAASSCTLRPVTSRALLSTSWPCWLRSPCLLLVARCFHSPANFEEIPFACFTAILAFFSSSPVRTCHAPFLTKRTILILDARKTQLVAPWPG